MTEKRRAGGPAVFLCYRREDASAYAGRLFDALQIAFGDRVFIDIDSVSPGVDFVEAIDDTLSRCDVLLAVIGSSWLTSVDREGQRRLDDPEDYVRQEISAALSRQIRVMPVLVGGARMPSGRSLPADLETLARRQAFDVSDQRWRADVAELIVVLRGSGRLRGATADAGDRGPPGRRSTRPVWRSLREPVWRAATAGALVCVLFAVILVRLFADHPVGIAVDAGSHSSTSAATTTSSSTATTVLVGVDVLARLMPADVNTARDCVAKAPPPASKEAESELSCTTSDPPGSVVVGYSYANVDSLRQGLAAINLYAGLPLANPDSRCPPQGSSAVGIVRGTQPDVVTECWESTGVPSAAAQRFYVWTVPRSSAIFILYAPATSTWAQLDSWFQRYVAGSQPQHVPPSLGPPPTLITGPPSTTVPFPSGLRGTTTVPG